MGRVPEISDERISELSQRIKPLIIRRGLPCYIKPCDPRKTAFSWDPKVAKIARDLKVLCEIPTYHSYGYYGFFKPSIAEVLAQIPEELQDKCCAFSTEGPGTAGDLNDQIDVVNEGFHRAVTTLYQQGPDTRVARKISTPQPAPRKISWLEDAK